MGEREIVVVDGSEMGGFVEGFNRQANNRKIGV